MYSCCSHTVVILHSACTHLAFVLHSSFLSLLLIWYLSLIFSHCLQSILPTVGLLLHIPSSVSPSMSLFSYSVRPFLSRFSFISLSFFAFLGPFPSRQVFGKACHVHSFSLSLSLSRGRCSAGPQWAGYVSLAGAMVLAQESWLNVSALEVFDSGNSLTNSLYWIATRPQRGDSMRGRRELSPEVAFGVT